MKSSKGVTLFCVYLCSIEANFKYSNVKYSSIKPFGVLRNLSNICDNAPWEIILSYNLFPWECSISDLWQGSDYMYKGVITKPKPFFIC